MKYAFFTSLDEINGIFIPKIWISSLYAYPNENFEYSYTLNGTYHIYK